MNALVSMCVVLGIVAAGCAADVSAGSGGERGEGGEGGGGETGPCSGAEPWVEGSADGTCEASQAGTQCRLDEAVVECVEGKWTPAECSVFTNLSCHEVDASIEPCEAVWEGLACDWFAADAGFICRGTARCEGGSWISNGVDEYECLGCEAE